MAKLLSLNHIEEKIAFLKPFVDAFKTLSREKRIDLFHKKGFFTSKELDEDEKYITLCFHCLGQSEKIANKEEFSSLLAIDKFYASIGGILGCHYLSLHYLRGIETKKNLSYYPPQTIDLRESTKSIREMVFNALKNLPLLTEIYPLGGAADRLHLVEKHTQAPLPAAKLPFLGKGLLKLLIEDVQAREYLYFKLFNETVITPICMMTSNEKNNHTHVLSILKENDWFDRGKEHFFLFCQPSVPTFDEKGDFCFASLNVLSKKPGGHGVLWKMLLEKNLFQILNLLGRKKALVRQINNPIAGIDFTLLAFIGYGIAEDQEFGFIGCDRLEGAKEGVNVLVEEKEEKGFSYYLSNVEYCKQHFSSLDPTSFLSNTNILFCDLEKIKKATLTNPFPGTLINYKMGTCFENGKMVPKKIARLESTMQNISDSFSYFSKEKLKTPPLKTFVAHSERLKTISPAKKGLKEQAFIETPEKAFVDHLKNAEILLKDHCNVQVPSVFDEGRTSFFRPSFIFTYLPALGPLYSIISQKIQGGALALYAEVILEIAEIYWRDVQVDGSFRILSSSPLGHMENSKLHYSNLGSKVFLRNVKIQNNGVKENKSREYWRCDYEREESLTFTLEQNAEVYAENITLIGDRHFTVEENTRLILKQEENVIVEIREKIAKSSWYWEYSVDGDYEILLKKKDA